ncbi:MAG: hypothetical protein JXA82_11615 [Sedimentisphaerales bacterium]|nr:hypothetical protein [Sedimentisphaerales bacterium]
MVLSREQIETIMRGFAIRTALHGMQAFGVILALSILVLSGCTIVNPIVPETGHYYINPQADFSSIGKVVVFESISHSGYADLGRDLADSVCRALQKKHLFNVVVLEKTNPAWSALSLDQETFTLEQMRQIRHTLNADAIVLGKIVDYQPYPHLLVGLNLKMLDLRDGHLVWGMEQVWDSSDKTIQLRMKSYYQNQLSQRFEPLNWQMLVTSPIAFHKFVSYEIAQTLPDASQILRLRPATAANHTPRTIQRAANVKQAVPVRLESRPVPIKPVPTVPLDIQKNESTQSVRLQDR